ncbi:archaemetzincin-2 isoform X2 [Boleophthalmus pectinirostris]|uniref:archaemetzincin-2 isoform X2 n=1 Tax=Boleophthalmus pectinirostris TaxID=150288 RepID=UPI00242EFDF8|nr:archaemetzincin-2 isoform X2 [Boleophthalmus pectinirostris]
MKVIQHSKEALRRALISNSTELTKLFNKYTDQERRLLEEGYKAGQPGSLFQNITVHSESDWIPAHPEQPQDFESFYRDLSRKTPDASHNAIYIQTIVTVAETRCTFRINSSSHNLQILTGDLLRFLENRKPKDAFCIVGITMIDLYPKDSWNFVFGQASLSSGMGIFSFARYDDNFYSRSYAGRLKKQHKLKKDDYSVFDGYYNPPISSTLLLRSCKTMTHEIGHMFGIRHCQWLSCVMQGSNHLEESDRRPLDFCPICLRKLQAAIGFNIADRYKALVLWMEDGQSKTSKTDGVVCHSGPDLPKPTQDFNSSKLWLQRCLEVLENDL